MTEKDEEFVQFFSISVWLSIDSFVYFIYFVYVPSCCCWFIRENIRIDLVIHLLRKTEKKIETGAKNRRTHVNWNSHEKKII